jgi:hypothetical protein
MLFDEVNSFLQRVLALLVDTRAQYLPAASRVAADWRSKYTNRVIRKGEGGALRAGVAVIVGVYFSVCGFEVARRSQAYQLSISGLEVILKAGGGEAGKGSARSVTAATASE